MVWPWPRKCLAVAASGQVDAVEDSSDHAAGMKGKGETDTNNWQRMSRNHQRQKVIKETT